jgi:DNA-directed RNA polymerase specialized sigma24 family protein
LVAQLDDDARELLRLRFAAGLTFGQIAGVLGRREGAVKMALHRLLERLKAMWEARDEHTH